MKVTCFLLLTISWTISTHRIAYAQSSQQSSLASTISNHSGEISQQSSSGSGKDQKDWIHSGKKRDARRSLDANLAHNHANLTGLKHLIPIPRSVPAAAHSLPQLGSPRKGASAAPAPTGNVRHRNPNPAIISGAINSKTSNTGMVNGTHMQRKY